MPGESHGQRRLAGYSPLGHKESDATERLTHKLLGSGVMRHSAPAEAEADRSDLMVTPLFVGSWDAHCVVPGGMDEAGRKPWLENPCSGELLAARGKRTPG